MKILVVNAGSSSLKFQVFDARTERVLAKGHYDGIGVAASDAGCIRSFTTGPDVVVRRQDRVGVLTHEESLEDMLALLLESGALLQLSDIVAVGHRVVHGGERYSGTTRATGEMLAVLKSISRLAPLHNPVNIACIEALTRSLPNTPHYAVFDTAFHQTIPRAIFLYALPLEIYRSLGIRKYGFHGTNHKYVALRAAELLGRKPTDLRTVTCHLGNGQSICAVRYGKSFNTSMGFTPLEGLPMGTRSGSFDPEIVLHLLENGYTPEAVKTLVNSQSGLLGISGISGDYRIIEQRAREGDEYARLAHEMLVDRIVSHIGAYAAEMGGLECVVFTAGIGENSARLRGDVLRRFGFLGLVLDEEANARHGSFITTRESRVAAMVIPANEELQIAREVREALEKRI